MISNNSINKRFIEKLPELKNILGEDILGKIGEERFSFFCEMLELMSENINLIFKTIDQRMVTPGGEKSPYLSNKKIDEKLKTAANI